MKSLLLFCVFLLLSLEGEASQEANFSMVPEGCYGNKDCLLQLNSKNKEQLRIQSSKISLSRKSIVFMKSQQEVHLVEGQFLIEDVKSVKFKSVNVEMKLSGQMLVNSGVKAVKFTVLSGSVDVSLLGYERLFTMLPGYEYVLDSVNVSGEMSFEFPHPANYKKTVRLWSELYFGSKGNFSMQAREFGFAVKSSAITSAEVYSEIVRRRVASYEQGLRSRAARKRAEEQRNRELRALFRKKNYLN